MAAPLSTISLPPPPSPHLTSAARHIEQNSMPTKEKTCRKKRHSLLPPQKCEWCGGLEFAYFKFLPHVRRLHPEQEAAVTARLKAASRLRCSACGEGALSRVEFARHWALSHSSSETPTALDSKAVVKEDDRLDSERLSCDSCVVVFANRDQLADHVQRLHTRRTAGESAYSCAHCGKKSNRARAFKNHLKMHEMRPSLCIKCGETFGSLYDLRKHNRTHTRERMQEARMPRKKTSTASTEDRRCPSHVCHMCARSFKSGNSLNSHLRNVHKSEAEQEACVRCGKRFNTKRALSVHQLLHEEPTLACPHCPKKLHTSLYLKGEYFE